MGSDNRKIFCLGISFALFLFSVVDIHGGDENSASKLRAEKIIVPIYQEGKAIPAIILYGDEAKPIGVRFEMKGVKVVWLGESIKDIRGTVRTPKAIYNQSTKMVAGNEEISYRSKEVDIDGVGFDIDQEKQIIHIRSEVKVTLKGKFSSKKQDRKARKRKKGKLSLIPSADNSTPKEQFKANEKLKNLLNKMKVKEEGKR